MTIGKRAAKDEECSAEKLRYCHYYEYDGALRAYANRAMVLAFLSVPTALVGVGLAAYVRLQPPTVIRVDAAGTALLAGEKRPATVSTLAVSQRADADPNALEERAYVRIFLERYLNFSPGSVRQNWAEGLNMMTSNLRRVTLAAMERDNMVGKIEDDQVTSVFHLRSLEASKEDPLIFTAFGVKEVHRLRDHQETTDKLVGEFRVRLIIERRSEENPNGLLIAEYGERLIEGERRGAVAQGASFNQSN